MSNIDTRFEGGRHSFTCLIGVIPESGEAR